MDQLKKQGPGVDQTAAECVFSRVLHLAQANSSTSLTRQQWLKQKYTIADVQEEVKQAQEKHDARTHGRVRKWLSRFSTGVLNYGRILDVLVQHHPEYVSLAWGTTKLLLVVWSQKLLQSRNVMLTPIGLPAVPESRRTTHRSRESPLQGLWSASSNSDTAGDIRRAASPVSSRENIRISHRTVSRDGQVLRRVTSETCLENF